jgi:dTMP kinase
LARGRFITLEGGEGAGKSTQVGLLAAALRGFGLEVEQTREPGGTVFAEAIRSVLVGDAAVGVDPTAEALAHFAARADHVAQRIRPALGAGRWVVSDRFSDSTLAYQGLAGGLGLNRALAIREAAIGEFEPDLTIILDVPVEVGMARARDPNRYEELGADFHERVRAAFMNLAKHFQQRCVVVDASGDVAAVHTRVLAHVYERLFPK